MNSFHSHTKTHCTWNQNDKSPHIQVGQQNTLSYVGPGKSENDAAAIRTVSAIPVSLGIFYWELQILNKGRDGHIGIGIGTGTVSLNRLPGWESQSIGWHGDDGFIFVGSGNGAPFGPCYSTGDTVGCGVDFVNERIFFTRNAVIVGEVPIPSIDIQWFPMVGFRTPGEQVTTNFDKPFLFDLEEYVARQAFTIKNAIDSTSLLSYNYQNTTNDSQSSNCCLREVDLMQILLNWLLSQGFLDASESFYSTVFEHASYHQVLNAPLVSPASRQLAQQMLTREQLQVELEQVKSRMEIVSLVQNGSILECLEKVDKRILEQDKTLSFRLHTQHFIELIRFYYQQSQTEHDSKGDENGKSNHALLKQILEWGSFLAREYTQEPLLNSLFCLIAYKGTEGMRGPAQWALSYFDPSLRSEVASQLNAAIQAHNERPQQSQLESLIKQAYCVRDCLAEVDGSTTLLSTFRMQINQS